MRPLPRLGLALFGFALLSMQVSCADSSGPYVAPASISPNSSTTQTAAVGTAVPDPPSVLVLDENGAPLAGATVTFVAVSGSGSVTGGNAVTSATGIATVGSWTVGSTGENTLTASTGTLAPVTFTANGFDPCADSSTHVVGATTNGELTTSDCRFSNGSFVDAYTTTLADAGTYVFNEVSTAFDTFLVLYGASGDPVGVNDDATFRTSDSRIKAILSAGNFVLSASSYYANAVGTYSVTSSVDGGQATNCENIFVVPGITSPQSLQTTDCSGNGFYSDDYYVFLKAGQSITVSMSSAVIDSYLAVYASASGTFLAQNDDRDVTTKDAQLVFTPSVAGFYTIVATSGGPGTTGAYTLITQ
jgi:hypothetical protein